MKLTGFVARRYLFSRQHISLISTLTLISIIGVTIGTALLIVVLSVFNGFFNLVKSMMLSYEPDIRIESTTQRSFTLSDSMKNDFNKIDQIQDISPYITGKALLTFSGERDKVVNVKGILTDRFFPLTDKKKPLTEGKLDLSVRNGISGLIVNDELRSEMALSVGDQVALMSAAGMQKALTEFSGPRGYRFQIRGSYHLLQFNQEPTVYIDLRTAQHLFRFRNRISGIDIRLTGHDEAAAVKPHLQQLLGKDYSVQTWYDLQKPVYDVMYLEKWASYIILMIIVLVAVLNIVGSLTMIVIQKNRDIGIMQAMGFRKTDIKRIFLKQGLYIGLLGCGLGGGIGLLLSWLQKTYGLVKLYGSGSFLVRYYPIAVQPSDVIIVLAGSLLLCLLASWYPAVRASNVIPAEAVRYE